MSCVVGITERGRVWIGADSCASNGNRYTLTRETGKLFRCGPMLIGAVGNFRANQLVRYMLEPQPFEQGDDAVRYLVTEFAGPVREIFKEHGALSNDQEEYKNGDWSDITFLIGMAGRLFHFDASFQVDEFTDGFLAAGCGADLARGALCVLSADLPPEKRILLALEASARFDIKVGPPFIVDSI
jgi:ATP-dependent protease HslVU (ClpYQ) peptidase subunit